MEAPNPNDHAAHTLHMLQAWLELEGRAHLCQLLPGFQGERGYRSVVQVSRQQLPGAARHLHREAAPQQEWCTCEPGPHCEYCGADAGLRFPLSTYGEPASLSTGLQALRC